MLKKVFLLIPSDSPTGPIKGAYALANLLIESYEVSITSLKPGTGANAQLDSRVQFNCLHTSTENSWNMKINSYRQNLCNAGGRAVVASISMGLSSDMVNLLCRKEAVIFTSVRGNLLENYRYDYGIIGVPLAMVHIFLLRWSDFVIAMHGAMADQVQLYSGKTPVIIGNFVDEAALNGNYTKLNDDKEKFIFVGSLTERKQPLLLIYAIKELHYQGQNVTLDIVGKGSQSALLKQTVDSLNLSNIVTFHGFVDNPNELILKANVMALPSLSEGMSRAVLEALYLGVPCVLRDVDGNREVISSGINGALFKNDSNLVEAMLEALEISKQRRIRNKLLPLAFRQSCVLQQYQALLNKEEVNE
jgi:glycosyltransferase involved in cell wall biosynthesis